MDFYFYMDFGSGDQLISPTNIKAKLSIRRGVLNDFLQRKELTGNFTIIDSYYTAAKTHYITNGFEEAVIKLYQNGIKGVGILKYEGWAKVKGLWDDRRNLVIFDTFRTNDQYTQLIPLLNEAYEGKNIGGGYSAISSFVAQGQNANANKLYKYSLGTGSFVAANNITIANLGRCSITATSSGELIVFDPVNATLKGYTTSAGNPWSEVRTFSISSFRNQICSIVWIDSISHVLIMSDVGKVARYQLTGATFALVSGSDLPYEANKFASLAIVNGVPVMVDELQDSIRIVGYGSGVSGTSFSVGKLTKPSITELDSIPKTVALIDGGRQLLQAYSYIGGVFAEVGNPLLITGLLAPKITQKAANDVIIHDAISGILSNYTFDGTDWTLVTTTTLSGGTSSNVGVYNGDIMIGVSASDIFIGSELNSFYGLINGILFMEGVLENPPHYLVPTTTHGATIDITKLFIGDMADISDNHQDNGYPDEYNYKIQDLFEWLELFQNYWYVVDGTYDVPPYDPSYEIKFTQPDLFSSFGTDINISSLDLVAELNQRLYNEGFSINEEETVFNNAINVDFTNNKIKYNRNNTILNTKKYPFTTDLDYLVSIYSGQVNRKIESNGLIMALIDDITGSTFIANSGTGILATSDIKNIGVSQSQIYNDFQKDYRYKNQGNIEINGVTSSVQSTCKNIIDFMDVEVTQTQIGLVSFPDNIKNLIWGTGIESLIMSYSMHLGTKQIIIKSRLHDL